MSDSEDADYILMVEDKLKIVKAERDALKRELAQYKDETGCGWKAKAEAKDAEIAALKSSVHSCNQGVIDGLQAEIARLRKALESIAWDHPMSASEQLILHYTIARSALSDKKGAV